MTLRLHDVERVLCPSPNAGIVLVANLAGGDTSFAERPLSDFRGTLPGAIVQT